MSKYIIYVDDDDDDRMIFSEAFDRNSGYEIITVDSGKELLDRLGEPDVVHPCLIIMDINMPQQSGIEVLKILKTTDHLKHIAVVMFSTSSNSMESEECDGYDADIIVKPSSFDDLREVQKILLQYCNGRPSH